MYASAIVSGASMGGCTSSPPVIGFVPPHPSTNKNANVYRLIMVGIIPDLGAIRAKKCTLCGMRLISCVLLVCITACSKRKEETPVVTHGSGATGSVVATPGSGSEMSANPVPVGPKLTTERFFNEQYSAFLQPH